MNEEGGRVQRGNTEPTGKTWRLTFGLRVGLGRSGWELVADWKILDHPQIFRSCISSYVKSFKCEQQSNFFFFLSMGQSKDVCGLEPAWQQPASKPLGLSKPHHLEFMALLDTAAYTPTPLAILIYLKFSGK